MMIKIRLKEDDTPQEIADVVREFVPDFTNRGFKFSLSTAETKYITAVGTGRRGRGYNMTVEYVGPGPREIGSDVSVYINMGTEDLEEYTLTLLEYGFGFYEVDCEMTLEPLVPLEDYNRRPW